MKTLQTESAKTGKNTASIHDYQTGSLIGESVIDWDQYRAWADGPSDVCAASAIVTDAEIARLGIVSDTIVFAL